VLKKYAHSLAIFLKRVSKGVSFTELYPIETPASGHKYSILNHLLS
jgi:hypothetical protein